MIPTLLNQTNRTIRSKDVNDRSSDCRDRTSKSEANSVFLKPKQFSIQQYGSKGKGNPGPDLFESFESDIRVRRS